MQNRISEVQVTPIKAHDGLIAFASLVFNDSLYLDSIGIYTRPQGGYRLTYPTRNNAEGTLNLFHPINRSVADQIEDAVITKLEMVNGNNLRK
jgi:DNA-binding cell septation regulator SpoVG